MTNRTHFELRRSLLRRNRAMIFAPGQPAMVVVWTTRSEAQQPAGPRRYLDSTRTQVILIPLNIPERAALTPHTSFVGFTSVCVCACVCFPPLFSSGKPRNRVGYPFKISARELTEIKTFYEIKTFTNQMPTNQRYHRYLFYVINSSFLSFKIAVK